MTRSPVVFCTAAWSIAALFGWSAAILQAGAPQLGPATTYIELVERYAHGSYDAAVDEMLSWEGARLLAAARQAYGLPLFPERLNIDSLTPRRLEAAALLHTDALLREAPFDLHYTLALQAITRLRGVAADMRVEGAIRDQAAAFTRSWYVVITGYWLFYGRDPRLIQSLLDSAGSHPEILLAMGSVLEVRGRDPFPPRTTHVFAEGAVSGPSEPPTVLLARAEEAYRRALEADPTLSEAQLRRGRVLAFQGKAEAARAELEHVRRSAAEPYMRYLADMFLGALHEQARDWPGAEQDYQAAIDERPRCHTAYLALAHVRDLSGHPDLAAPLVRQALTKLRDRETPLTDDPWWLYPYAQFWQTPRRTAELRAMMKGAR